MQPGLHPAKPYQRNGRDTAQCRKIDNTFHKRLALPSDALHFGTTVYRIISTGVAYAIL